MKKALVIGVTLLATLMIVFSVTAQPAEANTIIGECGGYVVSLGETGYFAEGWQGAIFVGTDANDEILGTQGADLILALPGNDVIRGFSGNDVICGGAGVDKLHGMNGHDILIGEAGVDTIFGGNGDDIMTGGAGPDKFIGGGGTDTATDFDTKDGDRQFQVEILD